VGADQEEGETEATGEKDTWQGAEEACTDWRKELKSGFKRGQSESKGTKRVVEGAD